jgi:hypothetical protein
MPFQERSAILREIGTELDAGALAYVTGDRENLETEVSTDVLRRIPRHMEATGKQDRLALVLYTLGGAADAGGRLGGEPSTCQVGPGRREPVTCSGHSLGMLR